MKKCILFLGCFLIISTTSCKRKKYTEVVEVPLPSKEQKVTLGVPDDVKAQEGAFELVKLPFGYDALQPDIDALTMETHYSKHYLTYTNNLNQLLSGTDLEPLPIAEIFKKLDVSNVDLKNNLGGYYNHSLYFEILTPKGQAQPKDTLAATIDRDFGSFDNFKNQFIDATGKVFGSGWTWLIVNKSGKLEITNTANQDNPLMPRAEVPGKPILGIDLWEHAYYLEYQNRRKKYVESVFKHINWDKVAEKFEEATAL
ncbi:superoxide dismutase [Flavobacterium sp.]|jgi:Fe-Mn family superoxide dismutase|uniref:superoxide dismutase n=1 Tax=Flavobacterium sp. TaxID=239 RepID=UPI0022CAC37B|nr:superoxide dismutase [Flavobacterium sp.]MCZ8143980.1 superoxide dismutase [Flavobacterium sp.]MCZ8366465.1 superoxide dismutase [Flavobacterium sp.]